MTLNVKDISATAGQPPLTGALPAETLVATLCPQEHTPGNTGQYSPLPQRLFPLREIPPKIRVSNPVYQGILDYKTYALNNKSVAYGPSQAHKWAVPSKGRD